MNRGAAAYTAAIAVIVAMTAAAPGRAQIGADAPSGDLPALIEAEEMTYDRDRGLVTAVGDVEIVQGERILRAYTVTYNVDEDRITARGNVTIVEPTGEVIFAEYAELTDTMKEGFIEGIRMLLQDNSRLAANAAQRTGGVKTEMQRAAFSPCRLCPDHPDRPPLWQVRAARVMHNTETHDITYRDATMEVFGVPVFYTPYLRHADPSVNRRTGFLAPTYGSSSDLGITLQVPFFWAIAPDKDLTLEPVLTTLGGTVFAGEYRQKFASGEVTAAASTATDSGKNTSNSSRYRGHVDGFARFNINENWRWGADLKAATDDTYMARYGISAENTLTSHAFTEGFYGRNFALAEGYYFQGLRQIDDQTKTPVVLPKLDFNYVSEPGPGGAVYMLDANVQALTRESGADTRRLSVTAGWRRSIAGLLGGDRINMLANVQGDLYHVSNSSIPPPGAADNGFAGRLFPQASVEWRYPFVRNGGKSRQLIEPVASLVVAPNGGNPSEIPNEDSRVFEFDDTNLFQPNRFPGKDRVEGGQRVNYGLKAGWFGEDIGQVSGFLGQSYRLNTDDTFGAGTGLEDNLSDIVGRVTISPNKYLDLLYRTRFDADDLGVARNEVRVSAGPSAFRFEVNYAQFEGVGEFLERKEIYGKVQSKLTDNWSATANIRRDLIGDGFTLSTGGSISYSDECVLANLTFQRNFTRNRDVPPTDTVFLQITLKHLGEFQQRVF